ncbi:MAG: alanine racemase [Verrucomicrobia bacterium]|nr:MAG: alanine racemase [Verrucomicrobiota bacterium]
MTEASSPPLRCWAEIDLAALERNIKSIRSALPDHIRYVAVVKADAYGHGINQTVARFMLSGVDIFAVANVREAAAVRELGPACPILLLSPILPDEDPFLLKYDAMPTVSSLGEVLRFQTLAVRAGRTLSVHLKIDTGMGRAGVWHEQGQEIYTAITQSRNLKLTGIFTHFPCAGTDPTFTDQQRRLFLELLDRLTPHPGSDLLIHADNSAGLETFPEKSPFNTVRVGLLQFGILPSEHSILSEVRTNPVLSFHARVGLVKTVPGGTGISYGRTHIVSKDTRIAVLTGGYGDGIPRALSNRGQVLIHGNTCPILGRVTMDQTVVDVSALPDTAVGDKATLVGRQKDAEITIGAFSRSADTIPWETLTSITMRVPRVYKANLAV